MKAAGVNPQIFTFSLTRRLEKSGSELGDDRIDLVAASPIAYAIARGIGPESYADI